MPIAGGESDKFDKYDEKLALIDNLLLISNQELDSIQKLETLCDIALITQQRYNRHLSSSSTRTRKNKCLILSEASSNNLRCLFVECLHSGSEEIIRDRALIFLLCVLSSEKALDLSWTVEQNEDNIGSFAKLLLSVISVEIHLTTDEIIFNYSECEKQSIEIENKPELSEVINKNVNINKQSRKDRLFAVFPVCLELLMICMRMLIGDSEDSLNSSVPPPWEQLPFEVLLSIKQSIQSIIGELITFIHDSLAVKAFLPVHYIRHSVSVFLRWVREDEDLVSAFISLLPSLFLYSNIPTCVSEIRMLTESAARTLISKHITPPPIGNYRGRLSDSSIIQESLENSVPCGFIGDVIFSLIPILLTLVQDLHNENDMEKFAEQLLTISAAFTQLIHATCILMQLLLQRQKDDQNHYLAEVDDIIDSNLGMSLDFIIWIISTKKSDLKNLAINDANDAAKSVLGCSVESIALLCNLSKEYLTLGTFQHEDDFDDILFSLATFVELVLLVELVNQT